MVATLEDAEPFSIEGNDIGVLVQHGFTGTTQSIRGLAEGLNRKYGFSIVAPRLPGHGTSVEDMETTGYLDWVGEVERALRDLAQRKRHVFLTGLSMGGALSLMMAARFPQLVRGVAPISAPAGKFSTTLAPLLLANPAPKRIPGIGSDIKAPGIKELAYNEVPVTCLREASTLVSLTRQLLHQVVCPTLVIQAREDHVVAPANAMEIVQGINADDVRLLWLNNSYHVATLDNDKDLIVERVGSFFANICGRSELPMGDGPIPGFPAGARTG